MAIKLGELLLNEKIITPEQLDEALKCQVMFDIKLGSSLVELGFITEEQLCGVLSRTLGVPAVGWKAMSSVTPKVLALVPPELAGRCRVFPIRAEGKKLSLAMADPTDFKAIEEVAFVTGCVIYPHIVPDVRITLALSKFYHIRGDIRYLRIEGELADKQRNASAPETGKKIEIPMTGDGGKLLNVEIPLEFEGFASSPEYNDPVAPEGVVEHYSLDRLSAELTAAENRDRIASVLLSYLGQEFTVSALFIIRNNMAAGWRGIASGTRIEGLESLTIPLGTPSVMSEVLEARQPVMGTLGRTPENMRLLTALGTDAGTPLLLVPIIMHKKVVAVVVVSAGVDVLDSKLQELQKLVYKASLAFEILIIKNKILMI